MHRSFYSFDNKPVLSQYSKPENNANLIFCYTSNDFNTSTQSLHQEKFNLFTDEPLPKLEGITLFL
jgi:hypothetical protein